MSTKNDKAAAGSCSSKANAAIKWCKAVTDRREDVQFLQGYLFGTASLEKPWLQAPALPRKLLSEAAS